MRATRPSFLLRWLFGWPVKCVGHFTSRSQGNEKLSIEIFIQFLRRCDSSAGPWDACEYCRQRRHRSWPDRKILVIPVMQSPNKLEKVRLLLYMTYLHYYIVQKCLLGAIIFYQIWILRPLPLLTTWAFSLPPPSSASSLAPRAVGSTGQQFQWRPCLIGSLA